MPVLDATHREAVGPVIAVHVRIRAVEVQVASVGTGYRRTPVVAVAADIVERPIVVIPVAACGLKWLFNSSRPLKSRRREAIFNGYTLPILTRKPLD